MPREDRYTCGNATIDLQLSVIKADDDFYGFLGNNAIYSLARVIHPEDLYRLENGIEELDKRDTNMIVVRMVRSDGQYRWMLLHLEYNHSVYENDKLVDIFMEDMTTFKERINELEDHNFTYSEYFSLIDCLLFSYDVSMNILRIFMAGSQKINYFNGSLEDWHDKSIEKGNIEEADIPIFDNMYQDFKTGMFSFEHEISMKIMEDDRKEWCLIKGKTIIDKNARQHVIATLSVVNPVTKKRETHTAISSSIDAGTELLNKRTITNYTTNLIASKPPYPVTIAIIDLDNFKYVNDTFGHMFGDEVLRAAARIIKEAVATRGVAGRIGGDEMFIVLENMESNEEIRSVLRTIRTNIEWEYRDRSDILHITCSIGCASYPKDSDNFDSLFSLADKALYLAKEKGRNRYIIFRKDLHEQYVNDASEIVVKKEQTYKSNKIGLVNEIISKVIKEESYNIYEVCEKIGMGFELDSIYLYAGKLRARTTMWGMDKHSSYDSIFFDADNYIGNFDKRHVYVNDNVTFLEKRFDTAFKAFIDMRISTCVQYYVGDYDRPKGFISFNKSKFTSKWSEIDIAYLSILGQLLGMVLIDGSEKDNRDTE